MSLHSNPTRYCLALLALALLVACEPIAEELPENDVLLAKVYQRKLLLSDIDGMVPNNVTREDSAIIVNTYTERWVREALMLYEAESNIPQSLDIDELVRDYRASLILHSYEQQVVDTELDSIVTDEELRSYYNDNLSKYTLREDIMQARMVKLPRTASSVDAFREMWKSMTRGETAPDELVDYAANHADVYLLADTAWYDVSEVAAYFPSGTLGKESMMKPGIYTPDDENHLYFLQVLDSRGRTEQAPLGYVEEAARKFIMQKRKKELLKQKTEELYDHALRRKDVKIYTR